MSDETAVWHREAADALKKDRRDRLRSIDLKAAERARRRGEGGDE